MLVVAVRVRPGSGKTLVSGRYPADGGDALVVRVKERAVDGQATRAVLAAVAGAFGLRGGDVELLSGARSRTKIIRLTGEESALRERLTALLDGR